MNNSKEDKQVKQNPDLPFDTPFRLNIYDESDQLTMSLPCYAEKDIVHSAGRCHPSLIIDFSSLKKIIGNASEMTVMYDMETLIYSVKCIEYALLEGSSTEEEFYLVSKKNANTFMWRYEDYKEYGVTDPKAAVSKYRFAYEVIPENEHSSFTDIEEEVIDIYDIRTLYPSNKIERGLQP